MTNASTSCWEHVHQGFTGAAGKTYTLSADFYIPTALQGSGGVVLGFGYTDTSGVWHHDLSQPIRSTNGWERRSFTFTFPSNAASGYLAVITQSSASGTFYFDNVQLELSDGANPYNLVENSNFADNLSYWTQPSGQTNVSIVTESGRKLLKITGVPRSSL